MRQRRRRRTRALKVRLGRLGLIHCTGASSSHALSSLQPDNTPRTLYVTQFAFVSMLDNSTECKEMKLDQQQSQPSIRNLKPCLSSTWLGTPALTSALSATRPAMTFSPNASRHHKEPPTRSAETRSKPSELFREIFVVVNGFLFRRSMSAPPRYRARISLILRTWETAIALKFIPRDDFENPSLSNV